MAFCKTRRLFSSVMLLLFCMQSLKSQRKLFYHQYTSESGLSENVVYTLCKDSKGFVWAGTDHGLNRFDGYGFKTFLMKRDDSSSLSSSGVLSIAEAGDGRLWVGTYSGINFFDPQTEKAERIKIPGKGIEYGAAKIRRLKNNQVFFENAPDEYYIAEEHSKIINRIMLPADYTPVTQSAFMLPGGRPGLLLKNKNTGQPASAVLNEEGKKWILQPASNLLPFVPDVLPSGCYIDDYGFYFLFYYTEGLLEVYNNEGKKILSFRFREKPADAGLQVFDMTSADSSSVWMTTNYGVYIFDRNTGLIESTELVGDSKSLKGNKEIRCLLNDGKGSIWMGVFGEGILRYDNRVQAFKNIALPDMTGESLFRMIFGLYAWGIDTVAAETGYSNFILISQGKVVKRVTKDDLNIAEIIRITTGKQWKKLSSFQQETIAAFNRSGMLFPFRFILHDDTTVICTADRFSVYRPSGVVNTSAGTTGNIQSDEDYFWVAAGSGLHRISKKDFSEKVYRYEPGNPLSLSETFLYHCLMDEKMNLWIGTKGGGLNYFDRQQEKFYHYTTANGLTDDVVYCIIPDKKGSIWVTTNRGVSRFNIAAKTFTNFSRRDGLLNSEFNRQGGIYHTDGNLYLSGTSGIDYFRPEEIESPETPSVASFSEIKVNDDKVIPGQINTFSYWQNSFFFSFTANDFIRPDLVYYRYKVSSKENWKQVRGVNTAIYSALPPGTYDFEVQASYDNLNWSNSVNYSFTIHPPWWQTGWFIALALLLGITTLWLLYRYRIRQLKQIHRLRQKISQDLHDEVGATLSGVTLMSELVMKKMKTGDSKDVQGYIERIAGESKEMAEKMNDIVWTINPRNDSLDKVLNKVTAYALPVCTSRNIRFHTEKPDVAMELAVSMLQRNNIYLICKEAINNAVKHSGAGNVWFSLEKINGQTRITIRDDGNGFDQQHYSRGEGLLNMKARADEIRARFSITPGKEKGTVVQLWVS